MTLKISNKQYTESLEPKGEAFSRELALQDEVEIMTEGTLYRKREATYLTYEDADEHGNDNIRTVIKIENGVLTIRHYGDDMEGSADLTLEPGVLYLTRFQIPMARINLEVYTHDITDELSDDGYGRISADYRIKMDEIMTIRNKLEIEVLPS